MRTSSPVTPWYVAPKLSPSNDAEHGGERGSSVWRGGLPTHRLVNGVFFEPPGSVAGGGRSSSSSSSSPPPSPSPPSAPSDSRPSEPASDSELKLPSGGVGGSSSVGGTG